MNSIEETWASRTRTEVPCFGEISRSEMSDVLEVANNRGYKAALHFLIHKCPSLTSYILSDLRIDWLFHCYNETRRHRCLDLGSGWGSLCFPLAEFFDETISLDLPSRRLDFQQIRAKQDSLTGMSMVSADMLFLPFSDNDFDLTVANGVLEWAGFFRKGDPKSWQLHLLREIWRCLKPGGCLYIGIENRFGLPYWFGARDHTLLPFTSLLPRKIADLAVHGLLKDKGWSQYSTYTYTFQGYKSLLKDAGFEPVEFYWTYPSYNYPKFAGRLHDGHSYSFFARYHHTNYENLPLTKRLLSFVGRLAPPVFLGKVSPLLWPSFLIFAWKGFKSDTVEDAIAKAIQAKSLVRVSGGDGLCSRISFFDLSNGEVQSISKIQRCLRSQELESDEQLLRLYAGVSCLRHSTGKSTFLEQKPVSGRRCRVYSMSDNTRAIRWLLQFQRDTDSGSLTRADAEGEKSQIMETLSRLEPFDAISEVHRDLDEFAEVLVSARVSKCSEHGDFWQSNILFSRIGQVLVLDWEFFRRLGNPIFDFCFFIISNSSQPKPEVSFYQNLGGSGRYSEAMLSIVRMFCSEKKIPVRVFLLGIPYVLARCLVRYSAYSRTMSPQVYEFSRLLRLWNDEICDLDFSWLM